MDIILKTGFAEISHSIQFLPKAVEKGKKLAFCHVWDVTEHKRNGAGSVISASCIRQTSVSCVPYKIILELDENRHIINVKCDCIAKEWKKCKHIYALIHPVNNDRGESQTSFEQQWGKPPTAQLVKEVYSKGMEVSKLFPPKPLQKDVFAYPIMPEDFMEHHRCPLRDVVIEENRTAADRNRLAALKKSAEERANEAQNKCIEACATTFINMSKEFQVFEKSQRFLNEKNRFYYEKCVSLNEEDIVKLCVATKNQSKSAEWFEGRKVRITASSKAHKIKIRKRKTVESLVAEFVNPKTIFNKNLEYGLAHERKALEEYKKLNGVEVFSVGFFVSPMQPWLGVSVDGVVVEEERVIKLLEIKCPISCRHLPIYDTISAKCNVKYLEVGENSVELVKSHEYYTQCQLQMYVTGMTVCDLFVWFPAGSLTAEIHYDEEFLSDLIPLLEEFYFTSLLPALCRENQENLVENNNNIF